MKIHKLIDLNLDYYVIVNIDEIGVNLLTYIVLYPYYIRKPIVISSYCRVVLYNIKINSTSLSLLFSAAKDNVESFPEIQIVNKTDVEKLVAHKNGW